MTIINPYAAGGNPYKGELHTHDEWGIPLAVITAYKAAGHDWIMITNHGLLPVDPLVAGILFLSGVEEGYSNPHVGHLFATSVIDPTFVKSPQTILTELVALAPSGDLGAVYHPTWGAGVGPLLFSEFLGLSVTSPWGNLPIGSFQFVEIYNAVIAVMAPGQENGEAYLDAAWMAGRHIWGMANDDWHDAPGASFNVAWNVVFAPSCTAASIRTSLLAGNFYCSNGAVLSNITVSGNTITITTPVYARIEWKCDGKTSLSEERVKASAFVLRGQVPYIRAVITRSDGKQAWTQPFEFTGLPVNTGGGILGLEILGMRKACEEMQPYQRMDCPACGWMLETAADGIIHCRFCTWASEYPLVRDVPRP